MCVCVCVCVCVLPCFGSSALPVTMLKIQKVRCDQISCHFFRFLK